MDLSKSLEFFNPDNLSGKRVHIIGCGSVGSTIAEQLARLGVERLTLYDFDVVESHNIANQMFTQAQINKPKVEAVADLVMSINPDLNKDELVLVPEGYTGQKMSGYVFLCVDNIDTRRKIVEDNYYNNYIDAMFDFRTGLTSAQHYAADWKNADMKKDFLSSMQFSHDEATEETPMSACHVALSVAPTIRTICAFGIANFCNLVTHQREVKKLILCDTFNFILDAF